jgi:hypothetical protein
LEKEITTFFTADLYGTAVSQVMWEHDEETRTATDFRNLPLDGGIVRQLQRQRVVTFDGPNYRNVDLLDFYEQPGFKRINGPGGMHWCLVRYYLDLDQLRFMASDAGGNVYDADEVERLAREGAGNVGRSDEAYMRTFESRQGIHPHHLGTDQYTRPVEIIEMWGKVPREFADAFDSDNVVISVANENFLLRAQDNPFGHRQKPFISYSPTPDPHYFRAPGKAEVAHQMQIIANRFMNHQLDAADLLVHPAWIYNRNQAINTRNLVMRAGALYGVDGDIRTAMAPVQMDYTNLQAGASMTETMWRFLQMGSGVQEDTIIGASGPGSDRQTAREFLGRREASSTRLMLESVIYDGCYLEPLADMFMSLNLQLLEVPREVLILGESARTDPVTGDPIHESRESVDGTDLVRQYSSRANGTTMSLSRETQKANDLTMFQVIAGANEQVLATFNMVNFLRQMLINLGYKNVNELLKQPPPQVNEMLGGAAAGSVPTEAGQLQDLVGGGAGAGMTSGVPAGIGI